MRRNYSYIDDKGFVRTWIIICNEGDLLVKCSKDDLHNLLLDMYQDKEVNIIEFFEYKSDEYYMFIEGDNYDVNKDYKNEISR